MQDLTSKAYNRKLQNFQNVHETTRSLDGELLVKKHYCQLYCLERFQPQRVRCLGGLSVDGGGVVLASIWLRLCNTGFRRLMRKRNLGREQAR